MLSLVFSILIEWAGMVLWWPEEGLNHSRDMLAAEIGYLQADFGRSLVSSDPARFTKTVADRTYYVLFEVTRIADFIAWVGAPPKPSEAGLRARLHAVFRPVAEYVLAAMQVTQVFSVRLAILALAMPVFVLFSSGGARRRAGQTRSASVGRGALGPVVHERALASPAPSTKVALHQTVDDGHQAEQPEDRQREHEDGEAHREHLCHLHGGQDVLGDRLEHRVHSRPQTGLARLRRCANPPHEIGESGCLEQDVVGLVGHRLGEPGRVRADQASTEVLLEITDFGGEHVPTVVEPLVRPPNSHADPLDEDREHQGQQQPFDPLGERRQEAGNQPLADVPAPRIRSGLSHRPRRSLAGTSTSAAACHQVSVARYQCSLVM